jgi:hypothetical protein
MTITAKSVASKDLMASLSRSTPRPTPLFFLYAYVTLTTGSSSDIEGRMREFIDRLQSLHRSLPLRTVPLEIRVFTPVKSRLDSLKEKALKNQYLAVDVWRRELENRYTAEERAQNIADVGLRGHNT